MIYYQISFFFLVLFSAFFSSAETSLISLDTIKLSHKAGKNDKKARLLIEILKHPEEFFSTILIGNNIVNIAAASLSTIFFSRIFVGDEKMVLIVSTAFTTVIILFFAEIIPKSYAFRYNEKLSSHYAYPIRFFSYLFYPFVKIFSFISSMFFRNKKSPSSARELTPDELKFFLAKETQFFKYNPENLKMIHEIIDIGNKDIKSIMTPRINITALDVKSKVEKLKETILEGSVTKIPLYKESMDHIVGIISLKKILPQIIDKGLQRSSLADFADPPFFISEFSSINYVLREFRKKKVEMAVVLDEYGIMIGILTLNDIFREILGGMDIGKSSIENVGKHSFLIRGELPVDEINYQLNIDLPQKKDYATLSGFFVYFYGKLPKTGSRVIVNDYTFVVKKMGQRKIEELKLYIK
ncbi:MAG: hemolysin family protein [Acidobacteriota bacterium]